MSKWCSPFPCKTRLDWGSWNNRSTWRCSWANVESLSPPQHHFCCLISPPFFTPGASSLSTWRNLKNFTYVFGCCSSPSLPEYMGKSQQSGYGLSSKHSNISQRVAACRLMIVLGLSTRNKHDHVHDELQVLKSQWRNHFAIDQSIDTLDLGTRGRGGPSDSTTCMKALRNESFFFNCLDFLGRQQYDYESDEAAYIPFEKTINTRSWGSALYSVSCRGSAISKICRQSAVCHWMPLTIQEDTKGSIPPSSIKCTVINIIDLLLITNYI